ncbi:MAG TPA: hypothetical protein VNI83_15650 [Vicinamibacterales bacterium]|nr:hypothetical protein [Vicinamibacterales bacterium]
MNTKDTKDTTHDDAEGTQQTEGQDTLPARDGRRIPAAMSGGEMALDSAGPRRDTMVHGRRAGR